MVSDKIDQYLESLLKEYYANKLIGLASYKLIKEIKRKNPYLLSASGFTTPQALIDNIIESKIQTSDETNFGKTIFEPLAIKISGGRKSAVLGVDLEIIKDGKLYLVAVKSGTAIFNAASRAKQRDYFNTALKTLKTSGQNDDLYPVAIVGYCYGRKNKKKNAKSADNFEELAGEKFWEFLSGGNKDLYLQIVKTISIAQLEVANKFQPEIEILKKRWMKEISEMNLSYEDEINWENVTKMISSNAA